MPDLKIFAKTIDDSAKDQIDKMADQPAFSDAKIRIMPDVHAGCGCVIGFTANLGDKVIPNVVGVDLGCSMLATKIAETNVDFKQLDDTVKKVVPAGFNVHDQEQNIFITLEDLVCFPKLSKISWIRQSMGTLGGGNHFIELDKASDGSYWLVIHSGSRNLGKQVATIYQDIAIQDCSFADAADMKIRKAVADLKAAGRVSEIGAEIADIKKEYGSMTNLPRELCYVTGEHREQYLHDMRLAQQYAIHNREEMANAIVRAMGWHVVDQFMSMHNFIGDDNIIRKGSIAAYRGERVIIPLNMRDGSIIGIGKGNPDWNFSAPHGAGRLMSRGEARHSLKLGDFTTCMQGIYTTTADVSTIDEAPMAYKNAQEIISQLNPTVDIVDIIKPVYNFKASDNEEDKKPWQK